ncbi:MAG: hypothetical protein KDN22_06500 [Verrucomicrobiae bacterium]|nr:hypothetical protein [Verrucomicrobiae bacterium]
MFDLEKAIAQWREDACQLDALDAESMRELESHLRDAIDAAIDLGDTAEQAFASACGEFALTTELNLEFLKVYPHVPWQRKALWMLVSYPVVKLALALLGFSYDLVEGVFLMLGFTRWIDVPWEYTPGVGNFLFPGVPEGESIRRIACPVLASGVFGVIAVVGVAWMVGVSLSRSRSRLSRWILWVGGNSRRLIVTVVVLGIFSLVDNSLWFSRSISWIKEYALMITHPEWVGSWEYYSGMPYLARYTQWIFMGVGPVLLFLTVKAWWQSRGSDPLAVGVLGYFLLTLIHQFVWTIGLAASGFAAIFQFPESAQQIAVPILQLAMFVTYILAIGRLLSKASRGANSDSVCANLSRPWLAVIAYCLALAGLSAIVWRMASSGSLKGAIGWMFLTQYGWILPLISSLLMLALAIRLARYDRHQQGVDDRFIEG